MTYQLAQVNVSRLVAPIDSRQLAGFVRNHDRVNAAARGADGFVWRLQNELPEGQAVEGFGWDSADGVGVVVNLSVWTDVESLERFTFDVAHRAMLARRREWFLPMAEASLALWWVPAEVRPSVDDAENRLRHLRLHGPTEYAFTFAQRFPAPAEP